MVHNKQCEPQSEHQNKLYNMVPSVCHTCNYVNQINFVNF